MMSKECLGDIMPGDCFVVSQLSVRSVGAPDAEGRTWSSLSKAPVVLHRRACEYSDRTETERDTRRHYGKSWLAIAALPHLPSAI